MLHRMNDDTADNSALDGRELDRLKVRFLIGAHHMNVIRCGQDTMGEYTIAWYEIDGVVYGATCDGKILDSDGMPLVNDSSVRYAIEKYEASK